MNDVNLPPSLRTAAANSRDLASNDGHLHLQVCARCNHINYPARELCGECLDTELSWKNLSAQATVLACSELAHSLEPWFGERLPWTIASVKLDVGPVAIVHIPAELANADQRVAILDVTDASGANCLLACPLETEGNPAELARIMQSSGLLENNK